MNTTTVSAKIRKAIWIAAATSFVAPTTTTRPPAKASASPSSSPTKATVCSGTIPPRPPLRSASTTQRDGPPRSASASPSSSSRARPTTRSTLAIVFLTGDTPMLPKSAYGYIQCKQRYTAAGGARGVAKGYRDRHLPVDDIVIDWFHYTKMGQMDMDPAKWPDPTAMNQQLHAMNFHTHDQRLAALRSRVSLLRRAQKNGWFKHLADGTPTNGLPYDRAGSDIDTTNPDAARLVLGDIKRKLRQQRLRLILGRRDRTRPAAKRKLLPHRSGNAILQRLSAIPHRRLLQRLPPRPQDPRPHPRPRFLSRSATQRRDLLVVGHLAATGTRSSVRFQPASIHRLRNALLEHRYRRLAVSALLAHARSIPRCSTPPTPAKRRPLRRLSRALRALVPVRRVPAELPQPRQPQSQRSLVLRQTGRADPRKVSAAPLSTHALHLLAGHTQPRDRRSLHAWPLHGLRHDPNVVKSATSTCSAPRFSSPRSPSRERPLAPSISPPDPTGTTSGPTNDSTVAKPSAVNAPIDTIPLFVRAGSILPSANR